MTIFDIFKTKAKHDFSLIINDRAVNISFRRSSRSSKIIIKDIFPNGFEVVYPSYCSLEKARDFFTQQYEWICHHAKHKPITTIIDHGTIINILGEELVVEFTEKLRGTTKIMDGKLYIPGSPGNSKTKIKTFFKNHLTQNIKSDIDNFTTQIGKSYSQIKVNDLSSRWGSCSSSGTLCFNLKLIFAPYPVVRYVIAHEVAHLLEMNHSKKFWDIVQQLYPGYLLQRSWLKKNGHSLKKYIL